jgi:hypothetical protein
MSYTEEHLARMNRSGQRAGAVGSRPTLVTQALQSMEREGTVWKDAKVLDFGAGKRAAQTAILRNEGWTDVTPYDIGSNGTGKELPDFPIYDVVLMSNVLNVQPTIGHQRHVLYQVWRNTRHRGIMICNLPREPRYGPYEAGQVSQWIEWEGFQITETRRSGAGVLWICESV